MAGLDAMPLCYYLGVHVMYRYVVRFANVQFAALEIIVIVVLLAPNILMSSRTLPFHIFHIFLHMKSFCAYVGIPSFSIIMIQKLICANCPNPWHAENNDSFS